MPESASIAIAGFQHETNTFAPHKATYYDFIKADSWPGLTKGEAVIKVFDGLNIPISGFVEAAKQGGCNLSPILWTSAEPSGYVTEHAFETIAAMICNALASMNKLDAVYLDLHGAMVTEHLEDGEGELLSRIRSIIGDEKPLIISLDLHANITEQMLNLATAMTVFRTYPHLDMAETGARAFELMRAVLNGARLGGSMRKIPFLIPLTSQCTDLDPCQTIYQHLPILTDSLKNCGNVEFATGFPAADIKECGAAVIAYGSDEQRTDGIANELYQQIVNAEDLFINPLYSADDAVTKAIANQSVKPVVLADAQDNPGAGGTSDTTGLLASLVKNNAKAAVLGVIYDPEVVQQAHAVGIGCRFGASLGAKNGCVGSEPYMAEFVVKSLGDGNFIFTSDMYKNSVARLGPMALLKIANVEADVCVIVSSERVQCLDLAIFRHLNVEPTTQRILGVKSSVHFRADFDTVASQILIVATPGANPCQLENMVYHNLRKVINLGPGGPRH